MPTSSLLHVSEGFRRLPISHSSVSSRLCLSSLRLRIAPTGFVAIRLVTVMIKERPPLVYTENLPIQLTYSRRSSDGTQHPAQRRENAHGGQFHTGTAFKSNKHPAAPPRTAYLYLYRESHREHIPKAYTCNAIVLR